MGTNLDTLVPELLDESAKYLDLTDFIQLWDTSYKLRQTLGTDTNAVKVRRILIPFHEY